MISTTLNTLLQLEPEMCLNILNKEKLVGGGKKIEWYLLWGESRVILLGKYEKIHASSSKVFSKELNF